MKAEDVNWGDVLRSMIEASGAKQKDVAENIGVSPASLSNTLNSKSVRLETIFAVADACGVKMWQFIASIESGLDPVLFRVIDLIINLPAAERSYIFKGIEREVEYILASRRKAVDTAQE